MRRRTIVSIDALLGRDGLLKQFAKTVLEAALNEEMPSHLSHEKHAVAETSATGPGRRQCSPNRRGRVLSLCGVVPENGLYRR